MSSVLSSLLSLFFFSTFPSSIVIFFLNSSSYVIRYLISSVVKSFWHSVEVVPGERLTSLLTLPSSGIACSWRHKYDWSWWILLMSTKSLSRLSVAFLKSSFLGQCFFAVGSCSNAPSVASHVVSLGHWLFSSSSQGKNSRASSNRLTTIKLSHLFPQSARNRSLDQQGFALVKKIAQSNPRNQCISFPALRRTCLFKLLTHLKTTYIFRWVLLMTLIITIQLMHHILLVNWDNLFLYGKP